MGGGLLETGDGLWMRRYEPLAVSSNSGENLRGPEDSLLEVVERSEVGGPASSSESWLSDLRRRRLDVVVVSIGSGANLRRGRGVASGSSSAEEDLLTLLLVVVVSYGSGVNLERDLAELPSTCTFALSLLFLVLVSTGSGVNFLREVRADVSTGSGLNRLGFEDS